MSNFNSSATDTTFMQKNLGFKLLKVCKKVTSIMGSNRKPITTCHLTFIVKILWK